MRRDTGARRDDEPPRRQPSSRSPIGGRLRERSPGPPTSAATARAHLRWLPAALGIAVLAILVGGSLVAVHNIGGRRGATPAPVASGPKRPEAVVPCTANVSSATAVKAALDNVMPGARICLSADLGNTELVLRRSGSAAAPIVVVGAGHTVGQVIVQGDHVIVDGVRSAKPRSPGFLLLGNNITVRNSVVDSPQVLTSDDDGDGIRFFGNDIKIIDNVIRNALNLNGQDGNHADAIQTFATSRQYTPSQRVLISGNKFENIDNMCLIAEGPNSAAGDGTGEGASGGFTVTNNYCDSKAGQAFFFDNITDVTLSSNAVVGNVDKAFSLQNGSVRATIRDNKMSPQVGYEVGIDSSSEVGYSGPDSGGDP